MASASATVRDDDPQHPNLDGIRFQATTDRGGIIAVPTSADRMPPVSYLPIPVAVAAMADLTDVIARIRGADAQSYLADFLDDMLTDMAAAIEACRPEPPREA